MKAGTRVNHPSYRGVGTVMKMPCAPGYVAVSWPRPGGTAIVPIKTLQTVKGN